MTVLQNIPDVNASHVLRLATACTHILARRRSPHGLEDAPVTAEHVERLVDLFPYRMAEARGDRAPQDVSLANLYEKRDRLLIKLGVLTLHIGPAWTSTAA